MYQPPRRNVWPYLCTSFCTSFKNDFRQTFTRTFASGRNRRSRIEVEMTTTAASIRESVGVQRGRDHSSSSKSEANNKAIILSVNITRVAIRKHRFEALANKSVGRKLWWVHLYVTVLAFVKNNTDVFRRIPLVVLWFRFPSLEFDDETRPKKYEWRLRFNSKGYY
jgi:hypothetical protein